jgi:hypothetical protein
MEVDVEAKTKPGGTALPAPSPPKSKVRTGPSIKTRIGEKLHDLLENVQPYPGHD